MVNILYYIIILEPSISFHVLYNHVTMLVTVVILYYNTNFKSKIRKYKNNREK